jgi:hypothetical protein
MCNLCFRISCFTGVIADGPPPLVASEDLSDDDGTFWTLQNMLHSIKLLTILFVGAMNVTVKSLFVFLYSGDPNFYPQPRGWLSRVTF